MNTSSCGGEASAPPRGLLQSWRSGTQLSKPQSLIFTLCTLSLSFLLSILKYKIHPCVSLNPYVSRFRKCFVALVTAACGCCCRQSSVCTKVFAVCNPGKCACAEVTSVGKEDTAKLKRFTRKESKRSPWWKVCAVSTFLLQFVCWKFHVLRFVRVSRSNLWTLQVMTCATDIDASFSSQAFWRKRRGNKATLNLGCSPRTTYSDIMFQDTADLYTYTLPRPEL